MGKDKQPLDLSRDDHAGVFMRSLATWKGKMATNHDDSMYGYVDIVLQIFFGRHRAAVELSAQFPDSDIYLIGKIAEATTEGVFYFHN